MSSTDPIAQPPRVYSIGSRPQADPLPSKRGEIGYVEGVHNIGDIPQANTSEVRLPERHPADRDQPSTPLPAAPEPTTPASPADDAASTSSSSNSMIKPTNILGLKKSFGGVQLTTLLQFTAQFLLFAGTIVAWVFATKLLKRMSSSGQNMSSGASSAVFVHVIFIIGVVGQLIFMERRLFRLRGERYSYLHPGEVLPRHRAMPMSPDTGTGIAFAPWNRPPLPTYAAALAQSGVGTGDVEDHLIAASPPPAYGQTRGSTLLLQGYLRDSLRAQRPQSAYSQAPNTAASHLSYVSRDEEWEETQNAERAQRLEETLSRLEAPQQGRSSS